MPADYPKVAPATVSSASSSTSPAPADCKQGAHENVLFAHNLRKQPEVRKQLRTILAPLPASVWREDFLKWFVEQAWIDHHQCKASLSKDSVGPKVSDILRRKTNNADKDIGNYCKSLLTMLQSYDHSKLKTWYKMWEEKMIKGAK